MMVISLQKIILQGLEFITNGNILYGSNNLIKFTALCVFNKYLLVIHQASWETLWENNIDISTYLSQLGCYDLGRIWVDSLYDLCEKGGVGIKPLQQLLHNSITTCFQCLHLCYIDIISPFSCQQSYEKLSNLFKSINNQNQELLSFQINIFLSSGIKMIKIVPKCRHLFISS